MHKQRRQHLKGRAKRLALEPNHHNAKGLIGDDQAKRLYHDPKTSGLDPWRLPKGHKKRKQMPGTQARHGVTCATISPRELDQVAADPTPCQYRQHDRIATWQPKRPIPKGF